MPHAGFSNPCRRRRRAATVKRKRSDCGQEHESALPGQSRNDLLIAEAAPRTAAGRNLKSQFYFSAGERHRVERRRSKRMRYSMGTQKPEFHRSQNSAVKEAATLQRYLCDIGQEC